MILILFLALIIAFVVHLLNSVSPIKVCALCAGISGAWLLATFGILIGFLPPAEYELPILMFMGATVVGIAFQGEKKFHFAQKNIWRWKVPSALIGLAVFYRFFENMSWSVFTAEIILILFFLFIFFVRKDSGRKRLEIEIENLKEKLKDCC